MRFALAFAVALAATATASAQEAKKEWKALSKKPNANGYEVSLFEVVRSKTYPLGSCPPGIVDETFSMPLEEAVLVRVGIRPTERAKPIVPDPAILIDQEGKEYEPKFLLMGLEIVPKLKVSDELHCQFSFTVWPSTRLKGVRFFGVEFQAQELEGQPAK